MSFSTSFIPFAAALSLGTSLFTAFAAEPIRVTGIASAWEAVCSPDTNGELLCGPPSKLLSTRQVELFIEAPEAEGQAHHSAMELFALEGFPKVKFSAFFAWPLSHSPIAQWKIDLGNQATCATSGYLSWKEHPPLICSLRIESRLIGVTLSDLKIVINR